MHRSSPIAAGVAQSPSLQAVAAFLRSWLLGLAAAAAAGFPRGAALPASAAAAAPPDASLWEGGRPDVPQPSLIQTPTAAAGRPMPCLEADHGLSRHPRLSPTRGRLRHRRHVVLATSSLGWGPLRVAASRIVEPHTSLPMDGGWFLVVRSSKPHTPHGGGGGCLAACSWW